MNVNKVILVGRLTRDPELRSTPSGQSVATVAMATNRTYTDKTGQRQEMSEYHSVVLWGKLAEIAGQYLVKGQECFIEGRLQTREYTAKDGTQRRITEIVGDAMQMGSKPGGSTGGGYTRPAAAPAAAPAAPKAAPVEEEIPTINLDDEMEEINIEDVPF